MAESAGELYVSITGDISALLTALQAGEDAAKQAGEAIAAALDTGTVDKSFADLGAAAQVMGDQAKQAGEDISNLATEASGAATDVGTAEDGVKGLGDQLSETAGHAGDAGEAIKGAGEEAQTAGEHAEEAEGPFSQLAETFKEISGLDLGETLTAVGLADLAKEGLEAYAGVQKAEIALTALTGSASTAEEAISGLKNLALQDALSFPTLVEADQRMTALGFDLEKIPDVLQAAADAAAATGRGFDTVTNAIDRMVLSGTANARMLASLGISLQDLGAQLGVSASQATAAFKALDPSDRIDIIVAALNKYQGVAQQVAQGISGQWQNLKTEWDFILEDMGAQLAPLASGLMSILSGAVLPFGKAVIDQFTSAATAVTEFVTTMKDVETQFITELGNMTGAIGLFRQAQQLIRDNGGADFELMIPGITDVKDAIQGLTLAFQTFSNTGPQIDQMTQSIAQHMTQLGTAAQMGGKAFQDAWNLSIAEAQGTIAASIQKVIDAQNKANDAVVTAKGVYDALNQSYQTGIPLANGYVATQQDVNRALQLLTTAEKSASDQIKVHLDNFQALVAAMDKAQATFANAKTILDQTATAFQNGTVGIGALDQAYVKVESSAKAAGTTFSDVTIKAQLMTQAARDQYAALTTAVEVWQKLGDGSIPGSQAAIAAALTAVDEAAKKVGISVTQVGDGLKFTADSATAAKGPVGDLANTLNGLAGVQQDGVIVNGKWVATLQQGTDATTDATGAFQVFKGSADDLNTSLDNLNTTMVYTDGQLQTAADLVKQLNQAWDDAAAAATNAAQATVDATDTIGGELTKVKGGSSTGKTGTGGNTSLLSYFEDVASAFNSPLAAVSGGLNSGILDQLAQAAGLFSVGQNQYSTTDPSKGSGTVIAQAATQLQTSGTTLGTSSTQLATAATALTTAATTSVTSAQAIQVASTVLTSAVQALVAPVPGAGSISGPALTVLGAPTLPPVPGSGAIVGDITTSTPTSAGPTIQLTITGNTISSQAAADQLATTMITRLRNNVGLKFS